MKSVCGLLLLTSGCLTHKFQNQIACETNHPELCQPFMHDCNAGLRRLLQPVIKKRCIKTASPSGCRQMYPEAVQHFYFPELVSNFFTTFDKMMIKLIQLFQNEIEFLFID